MDPALEKDGIHLSIARQCRLLGIPQSTYFYNVQHKEERDAQAAERLESFDKRAHILMEKWHEYPAMGYRKMSYALQADGLTWATEKTVRGMYRILGIRGLKPVFKTTRPSGHPYGKFPYLLKNKVIAFPNQVWATDITYIKVDDGMLYFTAVIDLFSRKILSWRLSDTMDASFCIDCVYEAILKYGIPSIFNCDQGSQYTSREFISLLQGYGIEISMDGKGRCLDNIIVERTWRTLKYEWVFLHDYATYDELEDGLRQFTAYFNGMRLHEGLGYQTPNEVYENGCFPNMIEEQIAIEETA